MYEEQQATMPGFTSQSTPNPNPNPPDADASLFQYSHGIDGLETQPAFQLDGAAASQSGVIPQITDSTTLEHPAGNLDNTTQNVVNTTSQPESIQPIQCEVCNITCNSKDAFDKHTQGKKHLKNVQKIAISSVIGPKVTPPTTTATPTPASTSTGDLANKKHILLQNGASPETLLYCEACNVVCNNQDVFRTHLSGKKHSSKVGQMNPGPTSDQGPVAQMNPDPLRCEICQVGCTSFEALNTHVSGKKHLKKLKDSGQIKDPPLTLVASLENAEAAEGKVVNSQEGNPMSCELCGVSCNTNEMLKTHLLGKKHQKNLEKSEKGIGPNPDAPCAELQDEGKIVNLDGGNKKTKRVGGDEDLEAKRQKILEGGAASDALRTCTVCNVVCSSPTVYISHLAGKKHAAMAVKQGESGLTGQQA